MIVKEITKLIGNTPTVYIKDSLEKYHVNIYAKLEYLNPFGSLKDRMAWEMIKDEIEDLKKRKKILIENSSGNTAKALAIFAQMHKLNLKLVTNRIKFPEKRDVLKIIGCQIEELPGKSQCLDPNDPYDPQFIIENQIKQNPEKFFFANQYFNEKNKIAHYKTGEEIIKDVPQINYFFTGVGTAGSSLGILEYFKKVKKNVVNIGVISEEHQIIPGIRSIKELYSVGLFDKKNYDRLMKITNKEAVDATLELIRDYGIITGPTGGASFAAIKKYFKNQRKKNVNVVFLACDRFEFYIDYFKKIRPDLFDIQFKNNKEENIYNLEIKKNDKNKFQIDCETLNLELKKNPNKFTIIDIRSNIAYRIDRINNSINIPETILEEIINNQFAFPKNKIIIFYCPFGKNSIKYSYYLNKKLNYKSYSLKEGFLGWKQKGLPTDKEIYGQF